MKAKQVKKSKVWELLEFSFMGTAFIGFFAVPLFYDDIKTPYDIFQVVLTCLGLGVLASILFCLKLDPKRRKKGAPGMDGKNGE